MPDYDHTDDYEADDYLLDCDEPEEAHMINPSENPRANRPTFYLGDAVTINGTNETGYFFGAQSDERCIVTLDKPIQLPDRGLIVHEIVVHIDRLTKTDDIPAPIEQEWDLSTAVGMALASRPRTEVVTRTPPLVKNYDPELERLLAEEEEIERQARQQQSIRRAHEAQ